MASPAGAAEVTAPPPGGAASINESPASVSPASEQLVDFDIPAQPLVDALNQFGMISGRSALFRSKLVAGLMAPRVRGRYTPLAALRLLLADSGLQVKEASAGAVAALVIVPATASVQPAPAVSEAAKNAYDAMIQARVWDAICAYPATAGRDYRSLLRFGIDATGKIAHPRLLSSTGNAGRDAALLDVLARVDVGRAPPPGLAQPLTMLILPGHDGGPVCAGEAR